MPEQGSNLCPGAADTANLIVPQREVQRVFFLFVDSMGLSTYRIMLFAIVKPFISFYYLIALVRTRKKNGRKEGREGRKKGNFFYYSLQTGYVL